MSHTYEFNISMSCGGCSGAVDRALKKLDGEFSQRPDNTPRLHVLAVFPLPAMCWPFDTERERRREEQATGRREMGDANR